VAEQRLAAAANQQCAAAFDHDTADADDGALWIFPGHELAFLSTRQ
jgi:hypothetical protein